MATPRGGEVYIVRYADDFVLGFQYRSDAVRFAKDLRDRLEEYGLELAAHKTRLIEFGRYAIENRRRRNDSRPETFDFLPTRPNALLPDDEQRKVRTATESSDWDASPSPNVPTAP